MEGFSDAVTDPIGSVLKNWFFCQCIYQDNEQEDIDELDYESLGIKRPEKEPQYFIRNIRINLNSISIYMPASAETTYVIINDSEYEITVPCEQFDNFMVQWLSGAYETN